MLFKKNNRWPPQNTAFKSMQIIGGCGEVHIHVNCKDRDGKPRGLDAIRTQEYRNQISAEQDVHPGPQSI